MDIMPVMVMPVMVMPVMVMVDIFADKCYILISQTTKEYEMGNRAVIAIKDKFYKKEDTPCIYLHWNGGRDSVQSFLDVHNELGMRGAEDSNYALARLTQIICNALGGELSCGISIYSRADTDNGDNGVYWLDNVDEKLSIVEREFAPDVEQTHWIEKGGMKESIIKCMPESYLQEVKNA
jgi:hypothetical protein